jgi:hypothetical protein
VATTRRTAVGAALAGLAAVSGCDAGRHGTSGSPGVSATADPDSALVDDVVGELTDLAGLVASVATAYPRLAPALKPFRELHAAHLEILGAEASTASADAGSLPGPSPALQEVRLREQRSQRRLVDASVAARSGDLARVLACMSAGAAQRLALMPRDTTAGQAG